ncbi:unannotated protein [freshwater metagenome]|uniref:Unannotated protein n=1 Tax=freshwater metagenome TaxID=449393 RepID=A0A6J7CVK3_9ZZZZ
MKSARDGVSATAEFSAGVKDCEDHLDRRFSLCRVHINRNTAAVVNTADGTIRKNRDLDKGTVTGESFVDRIVDDFVDEVVQTAFPG